MKNSLLALVVILSGLLIWFGAVIVRLDTENYALLVSLCEQSYDVADNDSVLERSRCLADVETRTSPLWQLYHALTN